MKKLLRYPLADPQAQALEIFSHPDGSADVRIDGGRSIKLTPVLAALLSCLAEDTGWSNDDLVGWKTYEQIASFLQAKTGKTYRRRTVVHHIYRLRDELLRQGGFLHYLIQNNRQYGWRLALKRKAEVASPLWVKSQLSCAD
jgi:DNA-binding response OmpR family regulator